MGQWADRYVSQPFTGNCGDLVRQVFAEQFGREVKLPQFEGFPSASEAPAVNSMIEECARRFERIPSAEPGSIALLSSSGDHSMHVGVVTERRSVLHVVNRRGYVSETPLLRLVRIGYHIEGFYLPC